MFINDIHSLGLKTAQAFHTTGAEEMRRIKEAYRILFRSKLGLNERRYAPDERFLSVLAGDFILNFYGSDILGAGYSRGVAHVGLELPSRGEVQNFFGRLADLPRFGSGQRPLQSLTDLDISQTPGPYRFYVRDPDGYVLELYTWEGVEA